MATGTTAFLKQKQNEKQTLETCASMGNANFLRTI
jgi:hypothetical protein